MSHKDNVIDAGAAFRRRGSAGGSPSGGVDSRAFIEGLDSAPAQGSPFDFRRPSPQLLRRRDTAVTYRVRLDLDGVKPPIWRRLDLPSDLTLDVVHDIVQAAMGWADIHLHCFRMGPNRKDIRVAPFRTANNELDDEDGLFEADVRLDQVMTKVGQRLFYEYDFGDAWHHTLKLEEVLPLGPVACVAGRRACPPEDCGGVDHYADLLGALDFGAFEGLDALPAWLPSDYDPDGFDLASVDADVRAAAEGRPEWYPTEFDLAPAVMELVKRAAGTPAEGYVATILVPLVHGMDGDVVDACFQTGEDWRQDPETIAAATRPVQAWLDLVGDGVDLAGDAPTGAQVTALREVSPDASALIAACDLLGLTRRVGGRVVPTDAARELRGDPDGLWRHIAEHLPAGPPENALAATLLLVAIACEVTPRMSREVDVQTLRHLGWRDGAFTEADVDAAQAPTVTILRALGAFDPLRPDDVTDLGATLAAEALVRR